MTESNEMDPARKAALERQAAHYVDMGWMTSTWDEEKQDYIWTITEEGRKALASGEAK